MRTKLKFRLGSALAFMLAVAFLPASAGAGDPIADAPVMDASDVYLYDGEPISEADAITQDLSCVQTEDANLCFDTLAESDAATSEEPVGDGGFAPRASCTYGNLIEWKRPNYSNAAGHMSLAAYQVWANYAAANNATTTSYNTGYGGAVFADRPNGNNNWLLRSIDKWCHVHPDLRRINWSNRFQSRIRTRT